MTDSTTQDRPMVQRVAAILWPSFVLAGIADGVFFTWFDPLELLSCTGQPPFGRMDAYSIGFFLFWLLAAGSSALTCFFLRSGGNINSGAGATD